jgi:hypothetical protein
MPLTRKKLEALAWKSTHRDYRATRTDGTKVVLMMRDAGTCSEPLASLTDEELACKVRLAALPGGFYEVVPRRGTKYTAAGYLEVLGFLVTKDKVVLGPVHPTHSAACLAAVTEACK